MKKLGIIGGSGLETLKLGKDVKELYVENKYGFPSGPMWEGKVDGVEVVVLSRHGLEHAIPPSQINYRANVQAMKDAGVTHVIGTSACGSLNSGIYRGDIVFPDQFIDFSKQRKSTFFEEFIDGDLKHTQMAEPFHEGLRKLLIDSTKELKLRYHRRATAITIEGPRFSTRAESRMFRMWGADIINMTTCPEVCLFNELGIPYASIALSTDFDSWKIDENPVTWEAVLDVFEESLENVVHVLLLTIKKYKSKKEI